MKTELNPTRTVRWLSDLACNFHRIGRVEEALGILDALVLLRQHAQLSDYALFLIHLAICLVSLDRQEDALADYEEALSLAWEHGVPTDILWCLVSYAVFLNALGQPEAALPDDDDAPSRRLEHDGRCQDSGP